ncbi:hypothetical protein SERLADRAFT_457134 [Serpula lacrymans var. lacrymans S7.9]|uniref:Uncharacterized protein n=1 Tax=Serpula lacrymans var. lacrymans (strain S7.9) TaxID=578457 RepID=F8NGT6_SERL9|nr:uncharacterized protein SERLADRAFT_457134 [Serpula lacrymans var. lacrymans S7.9]EGO29418.1 hypothetical protein SERLADRAFT_457134 [Serpula lacrymans var. lacrymans S7.9]
MHTTAQKFKRPMNYQSRLASLSDDWSLVHSKTPPRSKKACSSNPASANANATPTCSNERPGVLPPSVQLRNL